MENKLNWQHSEINGLMKLSATVSDNFAFKINHNLDGFYDLFRVDVFIPMFSEPNNSHTYKSRRCTFVSKFKKLEHAKLVAELIAFG